MGGRVRKQFMELAGKPVLAWSLEILNKSAVISDIILVIPNGTPEEIEEERRELTRTYIEPLGEGHKVRALVPGGAERYNSVYNGIEAIEWPCDYVFIHDGARPMITDEMLEKLLVSVEEYKAVVAASPSKDTVKITGEDGFVAETPDRAHVFNIQTPQCFDYALVKASYEKVIGMADSMPVKITDDAMVVEFSSDTKVRPIDTGYRNIKITTPEDLLIAEAFLASRE